MFVTLALCLLPFAAQAPAPQAAGPQDVPDLMRLLLNRPPPPEPTYPIEHRSLLPTFGASPAAGFSFGVVSSETSQSSPTGPTSVANLSASYSTERRLVVAARLDRHGGEGAWRLFGDWRYYNFTERTYGLGSDTNIDESLDAPQRWGRAHATLFYRLAGLFAAGVGYHLDARQLHDITTPDFGLESRLTFASGISANALFDSRDSPVNASRGWYGKASYLWMPRQLGSERSWESFQSEGRGYFRLPADQRHVIAVWGIAWHTTRGDPTYFDLPSTGWDLYGRTARGYAAGRYRGRGWLYGEAEYRFDIMRGGLLGAVAFANASRFSDFGDDYGRWAPAGGIGFRIKLDKRSGANLAIDYGWGLQGSRGFFLSMNEAF
jgi:hypothetical protein